MAAAAALLVVLALGAAGCSAGGADGGSAAPAPDASGAQAPLVAGKAQPEPGRVLLRFIAAARRGDAETMWRLLSRPTRASIGPTLAGFRAGPAQEFAEGVGTLERSARITLSRTLGRRWAVAAVAGERTVEGTNEPFAYGAALRREDGTLKLELDGAVVGGHEPEPLTSVSELRPRIRATVNAGGDVTWVAVWLDGKPLRVTRRASELPFTARPAGRPARPLRPGRHDVVLFAATRDTAVASSWTFSISIKGGER